MDWWKIIAIVASGGLIFVGGVLYWLIREFSDGMADTFGYPRPKRWRRP